jgi:hypothetical protein
LSRRVSNVPGAGNRQSLLDPEPAPVELVGLSGGKNPFGARVRRSGFIGDLGGAAARPFAQTSFAVRLHAPGEAPE